MREKPQPEEASEHYYQIHKDRSFVKSDKEFKTFMAMLNTVIENI
jgi:nucleoside diphosphate kinase